MKRIYILWIYILAGIGVLLFSCQTPDERLSRRIRGTRSEDILSPVRVTGANGVYGQYRRSRYSGDTCKVSSNSRDCEKQCREMYRSKYKACHDLPTDAVNEFYSLFRQIRYLSGAQSLLRNADPMVFGALIDVDVEAGLTLVRAWSNRQIAQFLIWVVEFPEVALALENHDRENEILEAAVLKLGRKGTRRRSTAGRIIEGLSVDLRGFTITFLSVAGRRQNIPAFVIADRLIKKVCGNQVLCEKAALCAREEYKTTYNRGICPYRMTNSRLGRTRLEKSNHCYLHGPNAWSFWNQLTVSGEISGNYELSVEECDRVCESAKTKDWTCNRQQ